MSGVSRRGALAFAATATLAGCARRRPQENIARLGIGLEPPNLDPTAGAAAAIDEVVYANVFEGLTRVRGDGLVYPALAARWEIARGGRDYLFHLHPDVRFHDGAPCDAEAVKFSLDRARAPDTANAQRELFEPIADVAALDAARVRVRLKTPNAGFLFNMAWGDAVIVSPQSAAQNAARPIGTGPFKFDRWARGALISLSRNADYWGERVALDGASFRIVPDAAAAFAALFAGDVDGFPDFPAPELLPQVRRDARFRIAIGASEGETVLGINNARAPFNDLRVRRALARAVDRQALIRGAMFGYGVPIGSHFAPTHPDYVDLTALYPYDPERARVLLREAGVGAGASVSLALPPPGYARRGGEIVAAQLRAVGFDVDIRNLEWAQWLEQVFKNRDFDLTIVSHTEPMDVGIYARDDYYFNYRSADFRAIMATLNRAPTEAQRSRLLQAAQRRIAEDCVNVFLFQLPKLGVWRRGLEGVWVNAPMQANDLTAARWVDR